MSRRRVVAALAVGALLLLGPVGSANAAEKPDGKVTVSGTVTDPASGVLVSGAPVALTVTSTSSAVGTDDCQKLYPDQTVDGATDGTGHFAIQLKAYRGSDVCGFDIAGDAQVPSGVAVSGSQRVQGLLPGARVPLTLPGPSAPGATDAPSQPATSEPPAVDFVDTSDGGIREWASANRPWLVGLGAALVAGAVIWLFLWLTVLVARAARRKGRSYWAWFWIAFFFLIPAAIIVAIMGPKPEYQVVAAAAPPPTANAEPTKRCPFCGEEILAVATKCKHCGEFLPTD